MQVVEAPEVTDTGLQLNEVTLSNAAVVIVPPVAVVAIPVPAAVVLSGLVTLIVVPADAADNVTVRTATTPF